MLIKLKYLSDRKINISRIELSMTRLHRTNIRGPAWKKSKRYRSFCMSSFWMGTCKLHLFPLLPLSTLPFLVLLEAYKAAIDCINE